MKQLTAPVHLLPTPTGAYHVITSRQGGKAVRFMRDLMRETVSPSFDEQTLATATGLDTTEALDLLSVLQKQRMVQGLDQPRPAPSGPLEQLLPPLLAQFSSAGRALLADPQGIYVAHVGFSNEETEELSALSAALTTVHNRFAGLLHGNLKLAANGLAIVGAAGYSELGVWPLHVDDTTFALVIADMPQFNRTAFLDLAWALYSRYHGPANP
jgi:hypothetical protein